MEEEKLKDDILFQIDMQIYDEFNDKLAEMNNHLGDIFSLRDVEEVEKAEKEMEIKLLRDAIKKQQTEIEDKNNKLKRVCKECNQEEIKNKELTSALADMVNQFADTDKEERYLYTGGLSALENAFDVLNIDEGTKREEIWKKIK